MLLDDCLRDYDKVRRQHSPCPMRSFAPTAKSKPARVRMRAESTPGYALLLRSAASGVGPAGGTAVSDARKPQPSKAAGALRWGSVSLCACQ